MPSRSRLIFDDPDLTARTAEMIPESRLIGRLTHQRRRQPDARGPGRLQHFYLSSDLKRAPAGRVLSEQAPGAVKHLPRPRIVQNRDD